MAGGARWEHAIHHVNARLRVLRDLLGSADPHQIARLVGGKMLQCRQDNIARKLARFAHAKPADGIAGEPDVEGARGRFVPKLAVHPPLHNAKQSLRLSFPMAFRIVILTLSLSKGKDLLFLTADG